MGEEVKRYQKAFISYASEDRPIVLKRVQMLNAVGIQYFQDLINLGPGDRWEKELYKNIDDCDLFLLFWSGSAKKSTWVHKEIQYAVTRKQGDEYAPPEIKPVIIEGPPIPQPPEELQHIHFSDCLLYFMSCEE